MLRLCMDRLLHFLAGSGFITGFFRTEPVVDLEPQEIPKFPLSDALTRRVPIWTRRVQPTLRVHNGTRRVHQSHNCHSFNGLQTPRSKRMIWREVEDTKSALRTPWGSGSRFL
uniref:Uncharacterized protein n=1 Tax=Lactuca sativa TaxID=4236 RepID=A0A9R1UGJ0_LACSA|nr:hypothetical protein LSAT_V11C900506010 [Lactuca sativa]